MEEKITKGKRGRKPGCTNPNAGRKGKPEEYGKSKNISFRIYEAEHEKIKELAEIHGMTVSKYLIAAALGEINTGEKVLTQKKAFELLDEVNQAIREKFNNYMA